MSNKRWNMRHRKRFAVRYGIDKPDKLGYTDDINHGGLFIRTAVVANPGAHICVELELPKGRVAFRCEVRWSKRVPANYLQKLRGGMGVLIKTFSEGEEIYHALCDELTEQRG